MADDDETTKAPEPNTQSEPISSSEPQLSSSSGTQSHESQSTSSPPSTLESSVVTSTPQPENRVELIDRARLFLTSPQLRHEDIFAKRRFLAEKGLSEAEIGGLLQELPVQAPLIPPRTYPQPPPSNLPNLLIGLLRIFTWVAGGSAVIFLVYYRYLLPLITRSYQARLSLKSHQKDLLSRLTTSLHTLKQTQSETFTVLPTPQSLKEDPKYAECHTLDQIVAASAEKPQEVPPFSVLRCAIEEFAAAKKEASSEELFTAIEEKLPWMKTEEGAEYQNDLWQTLSTDSRFTSTSTSAPLWSYTPPQIPAPPALLTSLSALRSSLPAGRTQTNPFSHTLQALSDFTGYITTQIYALPSISSYRAPGLNVSANLGPGEEELRREIRALKGLVLNRRSFMNAIPRASSVPALEKPPTAP